MPEVRSKVAKKMLLSALLLPGLLAGPASAAAGVVPSAGFAFGGGGLTSFYVIGFELGPWQEYLARELTPSYLLPDNAEPVHISWLHADEVMILPDFGHSILGNVNRSWRMDFRWESATEYEWPDFQDDAIYQGSSFERQYFSPGLEQQFGGSGVLGISAIVAYQRYSASALGLWSIDTPRANIFATPSYQPYQESGYGTGVRLDVRQELFAGLELGAGFQSRIDMEEFAAYRGVYSHPADLDIPARAHVGLTLQTGDRTWLNVAVERVLYSDISAFPSRYLPNRFLSLLGDSTSPNFSWDDLTVYSLGWTWSDGEDQEWHLDFSTRTQPLPTSSILSQALAGDLADNAMIVGYSRRTGDKSRLHFNAAWAPSEFAFGGSVLGVTTQDLDQNLEVEALWTLDF